MKFFLDQDVYHATKIHLVAQGHDVITAKDEGLSTADDEKVLARAHELDRILVTRDLGFGQLVFIRFQGPGVILLRMAPDSSASVHAVLIEMLKKVSENEIKKSFVTIEADRFRVRSAKSDNI